MNVLKITLVSSIALLAAACQSIQPFDGQTGYQRESTNKSQIIVSYVLDAKTNEQTTHNKLQKTCAKELGLVSGVASYRVIDQQEFVNINRAVSNQSQQTIPLGSGEKASFGLSSTPKLSNSDNNAKVDMLGSKPIMLKRVTVECAK